MADLNAQRTIVEQDMIDSAGMIGPSTFADAIIAERDYQDRKWGAPPLHIHSPAEWALVLTKEFGEAIAEIFDLEFHDQKDTSIKLRRELVQVAAVCSAIAEELSSWPL